MMDNKICNNWKIEQLLHFHPIEIIPIASQDFDTKKIKSLNLPIRKNNLLSIHGTLVEWNKVKNYYNFFLDDFSDELIIENFKKSCLADYNNLIISFGWNETVAKIPSELFLDDPLEYFATQFHCGFIYSSDFKLIIEISEDYYVHSNFEIFPNSKIE